MSQLSVDEILLREHFTGGSGMPAQGKHSIDDVGRSGGCHSQEGLCGKGERVSVMTK